MQLVDAFLANYAEVRGGLLIAVAAYPEWWDLPIIPGPVLMHLVAILDLDEGDLDAEFWFDIAVRRPTQDTDEPLGFVRALRERPKNPEDFIQGAPLRNTVVVPTTVFIGTPGSHELVFSQRNGDQSARVPIWIRHVPLPPPLQPPPPIP